MQARGSQASHQVLREVLKEVQSSMVPRYSFTDFKSMVWRVFEMICLCVQDNVEGVGYSHIPVSH